MDRNCHTSTFTILTQVALRKESVDRNVGLRVFFFCCIIVALRKESVDRNIELGKLRNPSRPGRSP